MKTNPTPKRRLLPALAPLIASFTALFVASCSTPVTVSLDSDGEDRLHGETVNIALTPGVAERAESIFDGSGEATQVSGLTGPVWKKVFVGSADAPATLSLVKTKLAMSVAGGGFTFRFDYEVAAELQVGDKKYPLRAHGTRAAGRMFESARRQAVEMAILDMARQAKQIMERPPAAPNAPAKSPS